MIIHAKLLQWSIYCHVIYILFSDIYGNENIERRIAKMFSKLHRAVQREIEVRNKLSEVNSLSFLFDVQHWNLLLIFTFDR